MNEWLPSIFSTITGAQIATALRALLLLLVGYLLARLVSRALARSTQHSLDPHRSMLLRRGAFYFILILFLVAALYELGFKLGVLLGAAGVLTVAIAFASQTSMSNLISGLFLLGEQPFVVGDIIQVGSTVGEVLSIDLLSVKLRKFDNTYVRVPSELLIKSEVFTFTKFPIRRVDLQVVVAYKEDLARVREVLFAVADANPLSLEEPRPLLILQGFGDSALQMQFSVWALRENYLELRNNMYEQIKAAFDAAGIEIPYPHRSLYAGLATDPFPVRVVASGDGGPQEETREMRDGS